jgi:hypothetical protein
MIIPMLGWIAACLVLPTTWWTWAGLAATWQIEVIIALGLFRSVGCRTAPRHIAALQVWPWVRAFTWVACWFPWPVVFASQGRKWWSLYRSTPLKPQGKAKDRHLG